MGTMGKYSIQESDECDANGGYVSYRATCEGGAFESEWKSERY
jgi:hypothetical protein